MAHGYLLHEFFLQFQTKEMTLYGRSLINRTRLLLEIAKSLRKIWPDKVLGARITGEDHLDNGIKSTDSIFLTKKLEKIGLIMFVYRAEVFKQKQI